MKKILFKATMLVAIVLIWVSCQKDQPNVVPQTIQEDAVSTFSKQIEIFDASSQSSVVLNVSSNNQKLLDAYSAENLELYVMKAGQNLSDVQPNNQNSENEIAPTLAEDNQANPAASVDVTVVATHLQPGMERYAISYKQPQISADREIEEAWYYSNYYSQINVDNTGIVCRTNSGLYGVYFGMTYKSSSSSNWSTIVSEFQSLANNTCYSESRTPCYQMKIRVKHRANSRFSVTFD
jgi:hypothetical protein